MFLSKLIRDSLSAAEINNESVQFIENTETDQEKNVQ